MRLIVQPNLVVFNSAPPGHLSSSCTSDVSVFSVGQGRGALQDIDQMSLFKPLCKFCASVRTVREIVPTVRRALAAAQSGTPGPVFIEFPIDTLYPFHLVSKEFGVKNPPKGLMGKLVSWCVSCRQPASDSNSDCVCSCGDLNCEGT